MLQDELHQLRILLLGMTLMMMMLILKIKTCLHQDRVASLCPTQVSHRSHQIINTPRPKVLNNCYNIINIIMELTWTIKAVSGLVFCRYLLYKFAPKISVHTLSPIQYIVLTGLLRPTV